MLSAPITITLIIKVAVAPFTFPGNVILCAIAEVIFDVILSLSQGYKGTKNFNYTIQYSYNFIVANYTAILVFIKQIIITKIVVFSSKSIDMLLIAVYYQYLVNSDYSQ